MALNVAIAYTYPLTAGCKYFQPKRQKEKKYLLLWISAFTLPWEVGKNSSSFFKDGHSKKTPLWETFKSRLSFDLLLNKNNDTTGTGFQTLVMSVLSDKKIACKLGICTIFLRHSPLLWFKTGTSWGEIFFFSALFIRNAKSVFIVWFAAMLVSAILCGLAVGWVSTSRFKKLC